ncbi:hypothetical protein Tco_0523307 [Tanacetum coccineum]
MGVFGATTRKEGKGGDIVFSRLKGGDGVLCKILYEAFCGDVHRVLIDIYIDENCGLLYPTSSSREVDWWEKGFEVHGRVLRECLVEALRRGESSILTPCKKIGGPLEAASMLSGRGKAIYISPPPLPRERRD